MAPENDSGGVRDTAVDRSGIFVVDTDTDMDDEGADNLFLAQREMALLCPEPQNPGGLQRYEFLKSMFL